MPKPRQQTPHDTVFDFIFGEYRSKGRRGKPGQPVQMPPLTGIEGVLGQMATAPYLYPTNQFLGDLDKDIDSTAQWESEPVKGAKVRVGPSGVFKLIGDPRKFISKAFGDYENGKKWGKWGAVTREMDAGMVAVMARWAGFDGASAMDIGSGIADLSKINRETAPLGQISAYNVQRNLANRLSIKGAHDFAATGLKKEDIQKMISDSAKEVTVPGSQPSYRDREARRNKLRNDLFGRGVDIAAAESFTQEVWGGNRPIDPKSGDDLGIWLHEGDLAKGAGGTIVDDHFNNENYVREKSAQLSLQRIREEKMKYLPASKEYAKLDKLESWVDDYITNNNRFHGLGRSVGNLLYYRETLKDISSGKMLNAILWGNARALASIFTGFGINVDPTAAGHWRAGVRLVEAVEIFHPVNLVKGIFWNGKFWEYLAKNTIDPTKKNRLLRIAGYTPLGFLTRGGSSLMRNLGRRTSSFKDAIKGRLSRIFSKLLGVNASDLLGVSIKEILKRVLIKIITQVLGNALLPGIGLVAGFLADKIIGLTMKLAKPAVEFIVLLIVGALALILMLCSTGASLLDRFHRHLNLPLSPTYVYADLAADSAAPAGMDTCPVGGGITCTQGPCGSTSHHSKTPGAVDLKWSDMGMNPNLVAPAQITIIEAKAVHSCADGSEAGGYIKFRDEYGYTWTVVHVRPLVGVGETVNAGDPIGAVQTSAEIPVSPTCWTGPHAHIQIDDPNGKSVDAQTFLNSVGCGFMCPAGDVCN